MPQNRTKMPSMESMMKTMEKDMKKRMQHDQKMTMDLIQRAKKKAKK